jgi:hypothetical protein
VTTSILFAVIAVLAVGEFLLFGALAEAYRDIRQIREYANVVDKSTPVGLGQAYNQVPSRVGLHPDLDSAARAVVVYVDKRCGTCRMIVSSLNGGVPRGVWLVVIAENTQNYKIKNILEGVDGAMRTEFGKGVIDYATTGETSALQLAIQASVA